MPTPDELLPLVTNILDRIEEDRSALDGWRQTADGQKVIQYVVQIGKYNTNLGEGKDISIGDLLDRALLEEVRDLLRSQLSSQAVDINWQQVSRLRLEQQVQRLTSNPLTHAEGIAYQTDQVYVPLGLVERKRQSRRGEDVSPEEGSRLYEETEITRQFEHEEFLEQVLRRGDSPRSGGQRLAIIGEPGAGKTTLLQQMAQWISQTIDDSIVIWISLADLQGEPLENYLLGQWLQAAVQQQGKAETSSQIKDAFLAQFQQGRVRLLLDGADEMQVSSGNPLSEIERQVRGGGLLSQARIVLTCRLNLWDGNRNVLDTFDTYRTLEFSYPEQVEQFVGQWFGALPEEQEKQAERLCAALKLPGKERMRDLVKNPLRLTLLCFNWYVGEGALPETKAGLYEQFVADFYEWKREQFLTTAAQRRQLNATLGELAKEAIDKEKARFRLRYGFVCSFLGDPNEPESLFYLAQQLGWLNKIGIDDKNRKEGVYAFFHPTFQEYFAALAIKEENGLAFFFNHIPNNSEHQESSYRALKFQWQETYLIWLGRQDLAEKYKDALIKALAEFEDDCGNLYCYRAYLMAISGLSEYKESELFDTLWLRATKLAFGCNTPQKELGWKQISVFGQKADWWVFPEKISKEFRNTIQNVEISKLTSTLFTLFKEDVSVLNDHVDESLTKLCKVNNTQTIDYLSSFLDVQFLDADSKHCLRAIKVLGESCENDSKIIKALEDLLLHSKKQAKHFICIEIAVVLVKYSSENENSIKTLCTFLGDPFREDSSFNRSYWQLTFNALIENKIVSPKIVQAVFQWLRFFDPDSIDGICKSNRRIKRDLLDEFKDGFHLITSYLEALNVKSPEIFKVLINIFVSRFNRGYTEAPVVSCLSRLGYKDCFTIEALSSWLEQQNPCEDLHWRPDAYAIFCSVIILSSIDPGNKKSREVFDALLSSNIGDKFRLEVCQAFLQIHSEGQRVSCTERSLIEESLIDLFKESGNNGGFRLKVIRVLHQEIPSCDISESLLKLFKESKDDIGFRIGLFGILCDIEPGNSELHSFSISLLTTNHEDAIECAERLLFSNRFNPRKCRKIIFGLKNHLTAELYQNDRKRWESCYSLLWTCTRYVDYPDFLKDLCREL